MSHAASEEKMEPNLTPLLDMVLQLVMFFMLVSNFTMEQVSDVIKLPNAQAAKPMDKAEAATIFLNVAKDGSVIILGQEPIPPSKEATLIAVMKQTFRDAQAAAKRTRTEDSKTVVIRADKEANYGDVFRAMRATKSAGFQKLQLRAIMGNAQSGG